MSFYLSVDNVMGLSIFIKICRLFIFIPLFFWWVLGKYPPLSLIGESAPKQNSAPESAARQGRCIPGQNSVWEQIFSARNRFEGEQKTAPESAPPNFYEFEYFHKNQCEIYFELAYV